MHSHSSAGAKFADVQQTHVAEPTKKFSGKKRSSLFFDPSVFLNCDTKRPRHQFGTSSLATILSSSKMPGSDGQVFHPSRLGFFDGLPHENDRHRKKLEARGRMSSRTQSSR